MGCINSKEGGNKPAPPSTTVAGTGAATATATTAVPATAEQQTTAAAAAGDGKFVLEANSAHRGKVEDIYNIGAELGRGGFAVVHAGKNKATDEPVAIKIIEKKYVDSNELKCLVREIDIMKKVNHPNVLRLIDIFESEANVIMVMELVTGGELFYKIVERGSYSEADAANIVKQLVTGVQYLHKQGVCHRDLKPENLLCSGEGADMRIKIADFGLSKVFSTGDVLKTACGTPDYAAPEVLRMDGTYNNAVDMWSVGVITYVLLCGYPPFYAHDQRELFNQILNADFEFPEEDWSKISEEAKEFIRALLKVDINERLTADQALEHPWLANLSASAATTAAAGGIDLAKHLKPYNERRKQQLS